MALTSNPSAMSATPTPIRNRPVFSKFYFKQSFIRRKLIFLTLALIFFKCYIYFNLFAKLIGNFFPRTAESGLISWMSLNLNLEENTEILII